MGYAIHIQHRFVGEDRRPISLEAWRAAVLEVEGVRLADGNLTGVNPETSEVISVENSGGDAEVYFPDFGEWERCFYWSSRGRISFSPPDDFDEPNSHVRSIARQLAAKLGAFVQGDDGEEYP